jgi:hypothetical protein
MKGIRSVSNDAIAWEYDDFATAQKRLIAFWRPTLPNLYFRASVGNPLPRVAFGTERAKAAIAKRPPPCLPEGVIADFAAKATERKLAMMIQLALRDPSLAQVILGAYVPARQDEPWPGEASEEQAAAIPPDIDGLTPPEVLLRELRAFPPTVVSLVYPGSMRNLAAVPGFQALFRRAITICRLTDLSLEDVERAVNEYGGRQYFILPLGETLYLGCIVKKGAKAFVIVKMTSDAAINLFVSICGRLRITPVKDPDSFDREQDLLSMMGKFD